MRHLSVLVCFIAVFFFSCEKDSTKPDDNNPVQMELKGVVQKGPFITGSSVQIQELNKNLSPNGISYSVSTEDNFGAFTLESEVGSEFIEVISNGFYYNEVAGEITNTNLSLRALSPVSGSLKCNINILTTLAKKRIVYLINEENKACSEAKQQAQNEILRIFSIYEADIADFDKMDISKNGKSDAILLAISAILQGSNTVSQLSLLISTIIEDIKEDGILNDSVSKLEIYNNAKNLDLPLVRSNIESRYQSLGLTVTVPDFEKYVVDMWKKHCTIISPLNDQTFNYNDSLTVMIDDFASYIDIINTKFYFNGLLISEDNEYPFSAGHKLHNIDFGSHLIKVLATDDSSNVYADSINIIVKIPPEFKLSSPNSNSSYNLMDSIFMNISSQPGYLEVTNVKYYFDEVLLADINHAPFDNIFVPDSITDCGNRYIKAEITDETGRVTRDSVNVKINTPEEFTFISTAEHSFFELGDSTVLNVSEVPSYIDVLRVQYYFDDQMIADIGTSPFAYTHIFNDSAKIGKYYLKCFIFDETGRKTSDSTLVTIGGMIYVEGGVFEMGDHFNEGDSNELPVHTVALSSFYISMTEVTRNQWKRYMSPCSDYYGDIGNHPVYIISWYSAVKYCNLRSLAEGYVPCYSINGSTIPDDWGDVPHEQNTSWDAVICDWNVNGYRLPTEAEWEYGARGGVNNTDNYKYSGSDNVDEVAWINIDSPQIVATKSPNQLGIYDMTGNVWEWCWDWYDADYYSTCNDLGTVNDPLGNINGYSRVFRGGYFEMSDSNQRVAKRGAYFPDYSHLPYGFRVVRRP